MKVVIPAKACLPTRQAGIHNAEKWMLAKLAASECGNDRKGKIKRIKL